MRRQPVQRPQRKAAVRHVTRDAEHHGPRAPQGCGRSFDRCHDVVTGVQNPDMVGALGIPLKPYMTAIAALGVGLAGLAGVLLASIVTIHPAMGQEILTAAFVVVVIGGLGSFWGVVAAALLVGVVRGLTIYFYPPAGEASMYLLMVLVLLFRPRLSRGFAGPVRRRG